MGGGNAPAGGFGAEEDGGSAVGLGWAAREDAQQGGVLGESGTPLFAVTQPLPYWS